MASLVTYSGGLRRIEFTLQPNEKRRIIRLGRMTAKSAKGFKARVEAMVSDTLANRSYDADTAAWLGGLDESWLAKLREVGLAHGVGLAQTDLGTFLDRYFATMHVKESTATFYGHTRRNLEEYFGTTRALRDITPADADAWRAWLATEEGLAAATVARRVIAARTIWRKAVRWKLAAENPFEGVRGGHQANESRKRYIPAEVIKQVMQAAPDAEWRAVIALARFGGLRTPSETLALRWDDIDWDRGTIRVTCPKLAHKESFASRLLPMFPELRGPLLHLFEQAEDGTEFVIERLRRGCGNIAVHFRRIIKRAGVQVWPKPFHNLRASRESELMREYDLATVCKWLGNSPAVAARHYATSIDLDADFQRAAAGKAQQKAQQTVTASEDPAMTGETGDDAKPLENKGNDASGDLVATADARNPWALLDLNQ